MAPEGHPALKQKSVLIKNIHFISLKERVPSNLKARIRHLGKFYKGKLIHKNNKYHYIFSKPIYGLAPGQHIVLYSKNKVIGGGEIRLE